MLCGIRYPGPPKKIISHRGLEAFYTLTEATVLIEQWRREYNQVRPHSSLGYWPPAPETRISVTLTYQVVSFMGASYLRELVKY